jgi:hypothetical protein
MAGLGIRSGALLAWIAAFAAVLGLIGWQTDWGRQLRRAPVVPDAALPAPVAVALLPEYRIDGGLQARQQTVERPVFVPTRRPAPPPLPVAQETAKPRMQKGQFVLTGTAVVDQKSIAFLREAAGGKARSVRVGETVNGLTVADVKPDRVRLTLGDESEDLVLAVAKGPRTTVQPVAQASGAVVGATALPAATSDVPSSGAGQPALGQVDTQSNTLLERRRAARAAQAASNAADAIEAQAEAMLRSGQIPSPPASGAAASSPPTSGAATPNTPQVPDPAWAEVYRRMQQPRR